MKSKITEAELFEILLNSTDESALSELFDLRTEKWNQWVSYGTVKTGALEDLAKRLSPKHAFDYIPYAIQIVGEQDSENLFITALAIMRRRVSRIYIKSIAKFIGGIYGKNYSHRWWRFKEWRYIRN